MAAQEQILPIPASAEPSLHQPQAGRWDGVRPRQRQENSPSAPSAVLLHVGHRPRAQEKKGFISETTPKALASKLSCQSLGLGEPTVLKR